MEGNSNHQKQNVIEPSPKKLYLEININTNNLKSLKGVQLSKYTVQKLTTGSTFDLIYVNSSETVVQALSKLTKHKLWSAPVIDQNSKTCIGLINILDLISHLTEIVTEAEILGEGFAKLLASEERFVQSDVSTLAKRNPFIPVTTDAPLLDAIAVLSRYKVARIPVKDATGQIVSLITQASVLTFISRHIEDLGDLANATISELTLARIPVVSINIHQRTIEAFKLMKNEKVHSVAVIDDNKKLVTSLSVRDIRAITKGELHSSIQGLFLPISQFIAKLKDDTIETAPSVVVKKDDTYADVVKKMAISRNYILYVIDKDCIPVGTIILRDVLFAIIKALHYNPETITLPLASPRRKMSLTSTPRIS